MNAALERISEEVVINQNTVLVFGVTEENHKP
jgi:hypothetical protein